MNNDILIQSFSELKEAKGINKPALTSALADVFRSALAKKFGTDEGFDIIVNPEKGDLEIWRNREIVPDGEVVDDSTQISISDARRVETDFQIGEDFSEEFKLADFGRRSILTMRQTLAAKLAEIKATNITDVYSTRIGDLVSCEVSHTTKDGIIAVDDQGVELTIEKAGRIPGEYLNRGDSIYAVVEGVAVKSGKPVVLISRSSNNLIARLMELEIPEVSDGQVIIKAIARAPGKKAKVSVESIDDRVDPVGACVGVRGSRINSISKQIHGESIDLVLHTENTALLVQRALAPAKFSSVKITGQRAEAFAPQDQLAPAIGKSGINICLARDLTGLEIDIYSDLAVEIDDVSLEEFKNEIDEWMIDELVSAGCKTARDVLAIDPEDLLKKTDLEEENITEIRKILISEFD